MIEKAKKIAAGIIGYRMYTCREVYDKLLKKGIVDAVTALIAIAVFVVMRAFDLSPVIAVVVSAIVGIIFRCYVKKDGKKSPDKKGESK